MELKAVTTTSDNHPLALSLLLPLLNSSGKSCRFLFTPSLQCQYQNEKYPFSGLFSWTTWVSRHQKDEINLDFYEARDDGVAVASFASSSRQITTPAPHHSDASIFSNILKHGGRISRPHHCSFTT